MTDEALADLFGEEDEPTDGASVALVTAGIASAAGSVRHALAQTGNITFSLSTPDDRQRILELREQLAALLEPIQTRLTLIDSALKRAFIESGAREMRGTEDSVRYELPRATYETHPEDMRRALLELVPEHLTREEVDAITPVVVTCKVDHTKANYFARNRGDAVRDAIEAHRRQVPGSPLNGKLVYPALAREGRR